jgi:hypothetical protein
MSSSTSSSERGLPLALLGAIAVVVCVELLVAASAPSFMESQPLIYETKLRRSTWDTRRGDRAGRAPSRRCTGALRSPSEG